MLLVGLILGFTLGLLIGLLMAGKCEATDTDRSKVIEYIKKHGSITSDQAKEIGINHVRSVVCKLKRKGVAIYNVNKLGQKAEYKFK